MNQIAERSERLPMEAVSVTATGTGTKIAPQSLAEVVKFAEVMCRADIALPKHLRGNAGACMAVAMQALEWQLSPFAVASKSYAVNGAIAYEAQLIAAVVNTRSGIKGRLKYAFEGEGGEMTCTVTGTLDGEECVYRSPPIGSITTKNSPLWKSDPQQQLGYFSARSWARRHCPEVILGVYDRDEAEEFRGPDRARDITDSVIVDPLSDEPAHSAPQMPAREREGFSASSVQQQTDRVLTGDIVDDEPHDPETGELTEQPNSEVLPPDASESDDASSPPAASSQEPSDTPSPRSEGSINPEPSLFGNFSFADGERRYLQEFAAKALADAEAEGMPEAIETKIEAMALNYRDVLQTTEALSALEAMMKAISAVVRKKRSREQAASYIATELLGCASDELEGRK